MHFVQQASISAHLISGGAHFPGACTSDGRACANAPTLAPRRRARCAPLLASLVLDNELHSAGRAARNGGERKKTLRCIWHLLARVPGTVLARLWFISTHTKRGNVIELEPLAPPPRPKLCLLIDGPLPLGVVRATRHFLRLSDWASLNEFHFFLSLLLANMDRSQDNLLALVASAGDEPAQLRQVLNSILPPEHIKLAHCSSQAHGLLATRLEAGASHCGDTSMPLCVASSEPSSRGSVLELAKTFESQLIERQAKPVGLCPIRRSLYEQLFGRFFSIFSQVPNDFLLMNGRQPPKTNSVARSLWPAWSRACCCTACAAS